MTIESSRTPRRKYPDPRHNPLVFEQYWHWQRDVEEWHFWFRTRRRILAGELARLALPPSARLLDVGCGAGPNAEVLGRFGRVTALDRSPIALGRTASRPYAGRVRALGEALPFGAGAFDAVVALDVLEHLDDDVAGARELGRVLSPRGALVLFVPALRALWGYNDDLSEHRRRYTAASLRRAVEDAGLTVERLSYFNVAIALPLFAARRVTRALGLKARYEHALRPGAMDAVLGAVFAAELPWLARGGRFPVGVSLLCIARRPEGAA